MGTDPTLFHRRHGSDSWFWALVWLYLLWIVVIGFWDPVERRFFDPKVVPASWALVAHVWTFSAWLSLLAIQAFLAGTRRLVLHRTFGKAMLPLAGAMVVSAFNSERISLKRDMLAGETANWFAVPMAFLLTFSIFTVAAWVKRREAPAHKRLILISTATLVGGAHFRALTKLWPGLPWPETGYALPMLLFFGGTWLVVGAGVVHDLAARRAVHPVYRWAIPVLVGVQLVALALYNSPRFQAVMAPFLLA